MLARPRSGAVWRSMRTAASSPWRCRCSPALELMQLSARQRWRGPAGRPHVGSRLSTAKFSRTGRPPALFRNEAATGVLRRFVGQPIATTVTEQLLDLAARKIGMDPAVLRRRNYAEAAKADAKSVGGIALGRLSLDRCHERLLALMDYDSAGSRSSVRRNHVYRGIGLAVYVERTRRRTRALRRSTCARFCERDVPSFA